MNSLLGLVMSLAVLVVCCVLMVLMLLVWSGAAMHTKAVLKARWTPATDCQAIHPGSVVFAPAFLNLGIKNGRFRRDASNGQLAARLEECAKRIALVVTQKAVSDQLEMATSLRTGSPVVQMHDHDDGVDVKTFAALKAAIDRFEELPKHVVLMAHPEQLDRAVMDLLSSYPGSVLAFYPGQVKYPSLGSAMCWHIKSPLGWISDWLLVRAAANSCLDWLKLPLGLVGAVMECPARTRLTGKIRQVAGEWVEDH